jgi:hypothetical protein
MQDGAQFESIHNSLTKKRRVAFLFLFSAAINPPAKNIPVQLRLLLKSHSIMSWSACAYAPYVFDIRVELEQVFWCFADSEGLFPNHEFSKEKNVIHSQCLSVIEFF